MRAVKAIPFEEHPSQLEFMACEMITWESVGPDQRVRIYGRQDMKGYFLDATIKGKRYASEGWFHRLDAARQHVFEFFKAASATMAFILFWDAVLPGRGLIW